MAGILLLLKHPLRNLWYVEKNDCYQNCYEGLLLMIQRQNHHLKLENRIINQIKCPC